MTLTFSTLKIIRNLNFYVKYNFWKMKCSVLSSSDPTGKSDKSSHILYTSPNRKKINESKEEYLFFNICMKADLNLCWSLLILGMTKVEQDEILRLFREGNHKVIIATSVAEEGLDIQKCSLVVRYDHVTNEIAMVQSRGNSLLIGC